jgi:hypothetical protein
MFFTEHHTTFSRILSDRLSRAIEEGLPEKRIRVIQTAIAVIKNNPARNETRRIPHNDNG